MKTKCHIITAAVIALTAFTQTAHATSGLPAPIPEFLSREQLTNWNTDQGLAKAHKTADSENSESKSGVSFFTGKPFDSDSNSYLFKYRAYDSELNRWTTPDPSGFPDGPNNLSYLAVPTFQFDYQGLETMTVTASWTVPRTESYYNPSTGTMLTISYTARVTRDIVVDYTATADSVTLNSMTLAPLPWYQIDGIAGSLYFVGFSLGSPNLQYTPTAGTTPSGNAKLTVNWNLTEVSSITFSPSQGNAQVETPFGWTWELPLDSGSFELTE